MVFSEIYNPKQHESQWYCNKVQLPKNCAQVSVLYLFTYFLILLYSFLAPISEAHVIFIPPDDCEHWTSTGEKQTQSQLLIQSVLIKSTPVNHCVVKTTIILCNTHIRPLEMSWNALNVRKQEQTDREKKEGDVTHHSSCLQHNFSQTGCSYSDSFAHKHMHAAL